LPCPDHLFNLREAALQQDPKVGMGLDNLLPIRIFPGPKPSQKSFYHYFDLVDGLRSVVFTR
jgi:hypothetical protein